MTTPTTRPDPIPLAPRKALHRRSASRGRRHVLRVATLTCACAGALCCAGARAYDAAAVTGARTDRPHRATHRVHPASAPRTDAAALGAPPAADQFARGPAPIAEVYRCGDSYSAQPCAGATPLDVSDARTDAQRRQAQDVAARDERLASWFAAQRHEREDAASAPTKSRSTADHGCIPTRTVACPSPRIRTRRAASPKTPKPGAVTASK